MADTKQQWYKDAKYGLFIHWGLYSILAGEWKDPKTGEVTKTDRIAEWIENNLNIDKEDYIDEANKTVEMGGGSDTYYITTLNKSDEEIAATVKFIKYLTSVDSINEMCKSSPTTYAEKVTIDTGNYLLDDVNAIMAENTESKLEIPTYDSNTAAMDTIRNSLQALATGASAQEVGDDIVDKMSAYE